LDIFADRSKIDLLTSL